MNLLCNTQLNNFRMKSYAFSGSSFVAQAPPRNWIFHLIYSYLITRNKRFTTVKYRKKQNPSDRKTSKQIGYAYKLGLMESSLPLSARLSIRRATYERTYTAEEWQSSRPIGVEQGQSSARTLEYVNLNHCRLKIYTSPQYVILDIFAYWMLSHNCELFRCGIQKQHVV